MSKIYDTAIWEYLKNPWAWWLTLDELALKFHDYKKISLSDLTQKKKLSLKEVDLKFASKYAAEETYIIWELYEKQKTEKLNENLILEKIEFPLIEVLKTMELNWVKIDRDKLKWIWILLEQEIEILKKEIFTLAWVEFNIKSPSQVAKIFFEKLQLKSWKKTKTGFSVDNEVLEELAKTSEIARKTIDYRTYTKLLWTYVEWLLWELDIDDLIHTNYNQTISSTWRLSSVNPNLQNIPTWKWISWEIRNAFIPFSDDEIIMAFDYSQIELRILAILSQDVNLIEAFSNNLDIHNITASFIFWKNDISKQERKVAKSVNFWIIYWISAFWLSKMIDWSIADSKIYIDKFYEQYPGVRIYFDKIIENCKKTWYVETAFWRKRYIKWINDANRIIAEASKREAINMPIQWTSADIIKLAMIEINKFLITNKLQSKMIMQVHDELVFSVKKTEKKLLEMEIKYIMENVLNYNKLNVQIPKNSVLLTVDFWEWKNWGEAK